MLNKEAYEDGLEEMLIKGYKFAFDKCKNKVSNCLSIDCNQCAFNNNAKSCIEGRKEWLNSEYIEPQVDWSKVPIDTKILVRDTENDPWTNRYFAEYSNGIVYAWTNGKTSWSARNNDVCCWRYAKLAEYNFKRSKHK